MSSAALSVEHGVFALTRRISYNDLARVRSRPYFAASTCYTNLRLRSFESEKPVPLDPSPEE
jgi:hypothetical protein